MRKIDADVLKCEMQILVSNLEDMAESMGGQGLLCKRLNTLAEGVQRGIDILNEQPTIEERKTGKWEERDRCHIECPFCHSVWADFENMVEYFNYCPCCGAELKGEKYERMDSSE